VASNFSVSQPLTFVSVAERTGSFTSLGRLFYATGGSIRFGFGSAANQVALNAGTSFSATANDSVPPALQGIANNTSSTVVVDGTATSGSAGTGAISTQTLSIFNDGTVDSVPGSYCEGGLWPSGFNSTQYGNMNTNLHSSTSGWNF
jgi:hypothetical protein